MFIIFGQRSWTGTTSRTGQFTCPNCQQNATWAECHEYTWFHIYWIPLIPVGDERLGIQCAACSTIWEEEVLSQAPYDPVASYPPALPGSTAPSKWNCPSCGEIQPEHIDRCPMCQVRRDGSSV